MTEIRFYHLEKHSLEQVLPPLLGRILADGRRAVIRTASEDGARALSDGLWSYDPASFIPHGTADDGHSDAQPVYITAAQENPNAANVLILTQGADWGDLSTIPLCCVVFNGRDPEALAQARARWSDYKAQGFELTYWQQGEKGWEKKAG